MSTLNLTLVCPGDHPPPACPDRLVEVQGITTMRYAALHVAEALGYGEDDEPWVLLWVDVDNKLERVPPDDLAQDWEDFRLMLARQDRRRA